MTPELHALVEAYADGDLDEAEARQLAAAIAGGGPEGDEILAAIAFSGRLAAATSPVGDEDVVRAVINRLAAEREGTAVAAAVLRRLPPQRRAGRGRRGWLIAAGLLLAFGALALVVAPQLRQPEPVPFARHAADGAAIEAGATVASGAEARVILVSDGTSLTLHPRSSLTLGQGRRGPEVRLIDGMLDAAVAKQPAEQRFRFVTATAEIDVLGTRLAVSAGTAGTLLHVEEGLVRMHSAGGGDDLDVAAGHAALALTSCPVREIPVADLAAAGLAIRGEADDPAKTGAKPGEEPPVNPFLAVLAGTKPGGVVLAVGDQPASQAAANIIRDAIRRLPGQAGWNQMAKAADFDAQPHAVTGQVHVIAVGTLADNVVLQGRSWLPTWWMDWDWYLNTFPLRLPGTKLGMPYQPQSGFTAAGFGEWAKGEAGIGLIEVDRSHLFMEWVGRSRVEQVSGGPVPGKGNFRLTENKLQSQTYPTYPKDFPLRLLVRITGTGPEGLKAAATAFAERTMLNGVVLAAEAKPGVGAAQSTLAKQRYAAQLPFTPPAGAGGCTYLGWLLPDAFEYDAVFSECGIIPLQLFRLKYLAPTGITSFWTTPHRRAGEFEIACLKFSDAETANRAAKALDQAARNLVPFKDGKVRNWGVLVNGRNVYLRSMAGQAGEQLLAACAKLPAW